MDYAIETNTVKVNDDGESALRAGLSYGGRNSRHVKDDRATRK